MIRIVQQQKLNQKLSPQQIQFMKLLKIPSAELEERIKDEIENNPALELEENTQEPNNEYDYVESDYDNQNYDDRVKEEVDPYESIDISDYLHQENSTKHYYDNDNDDDDAHTHTPIRVENTFHEYLISQLGLLSLNKQETLIAKQIIGSIDDDGYLRREPEAIVDDLAFKQGINTTLEEIEKIIKTIKNFDPPGVACSSLQECLLEQLKRLDKSNNKSTINIAISILSRCFDEFTKKHYDKIKTRLKIDDEQIKEAIHIIIKLTPKPGNAFHTQRLDNYIIPDFFIFNNDGKLEMTLNARNAPELKVSEGYLNMKKDFENSGKKDKSKKDALTFLKHKIEAAKWFIDSIKQRQITLIQTMTAIMQAQKQFLLSGNENDMRPMILKNISDKIGLDISTISRVVNSKYVQTEFGVYPLKYFFSEGLTTESGEEVSTLEIKKALSEIVDNENKSIPLNDGQLTDELLAKGYQVARRTVAKYREQLNIPPARLRKTI